jgi:RNA polymerase sigma-70 factor (ECF subfamily)
MIARRMNDSRHDDSSAAVVPFPTPADADSARDEETALLLRVQRDGDRAAFRRLFEMLAPRINGHLRRDGVPAADAENCQQDVWLTVWRKAGQFDPARASARTWIFTLVRNRLIDINRAARREAGALAEWQVTAPGRDGYDEDLLGRALGARAARVLRRLPVEQAEVLVKCYVEGKSQREIATELAVPIGTIKSRARLAFERMKALLEGSR